MSNIMGQTITITLFGESHGSSVGAVLDGLPAGEVIDWDQVRREMERRAPHYRRPALKQMPLKFKAVFSMDIQREHPYVPLLKTVIIILGIMTISGMLCGRGMQITLEKSDTAVFRIFAAAAIFPDALRHLWFLQEPLLLSCCRSAV